MDIQLFKVYYDSPLKNHSISDIFDTIDIYGGVLLDICEEYAKISMYVIENALGVIYDTCLMILEFYIKNYTNVNIFVIMMLFIYVIVLIKSVVIKSDKIIDKSNDIFYETIYQSRTINKNLKSETSKLLKSIENMFEYKNDGEIVEFKRKLKEILDNGQDRSAKKISRINTMMTFDDDEDFQKKMVKKIKQH